MSIREHYRGNEKLAVVIITVDPAKNRIEAVGKDAAVIQIQPGSNGPFFRWPQQGERWIASRDNDLYWRLENRIDVISQTLVPGDIVGPDGLVHLKTPLVSVLPTPVIDGQEVYFQNTAMATDGIVWHLRYRSTSASAYKWEFVSGTSLFAQIDATETTTSGTYVNLATTGPVVALPLPGDYLIGLGAGVSNDTASQEAWMSYAIGAGSASDNDNVRFSNIGTANKSIAVMREMKKTGLLNVNLTAKYRVGGGTGYFVHRWIRATPIRVG